MWSDVEEQIIDGDLTAALAYVTPAGGAVLQILVGAIAAGLGDHDWGDLVAAAERQADVELHWNPDS